MVPDAVKVVEMCLFVVDYLLKQPGAGVVATGAADLNEAVLSFDGAVLKAGIRVKHERDLAVFCRLAGR